MGDPQNAWLMENAIFSNGGELYPTNRKPPTSQPKSQSLSLRVFRSFANFFSSSPSNGSNGFDGFDGSGPSSNLTRSASGGDASGDQCGSAGATGRPRRLAKRKFGGWKPQGFRPSLENMWYLCVIYVYIHIHIHIHKHIHIRQSINIDIVWYTVLIYSKPKLIFNLFKFGMIW